ncbi:MAG: flippase [Methanobacteriaceae archaeon]
MSLIKSIFKNTGWLFISQIITSVFGFVWTILIARYLGVEDFGILTFAISFTGIFSIFMDVGISTYITREISRDSSSFGKYIRNTIPLKLLLSLLSFLAIIVVLLIMNLFMGYNVLTITVVLIMGMQVFFSSMGYLFIGVFQAYEKMKYQAIGIILNSSILMLGVIACMLLDLGLATVAIMYLMGSLLMAIYLYITLNKQTKIPKLEIDIPFWKKTFKYSLSFGIISLFTQIYFWIDTVMISFLKGEYAVGVYSSAYKFVFVLLTMYNVYMSVVFPYMSKLYQNSTDLLKISYEKSLKYLLLFIVPTAIFTSFYAVDIITLIYGPEYILASSVLQILIWNIVFLFVNGAAAMLLNASGNEFRVAKINGIAATFNVVVNLIMIPYLSYIGASIATVLTGILICILMNYIILKENYTPNKRLIEDIIKIIISSLILLVVLYVVNTGIMPGIPKISLFLAVPISLIVYFVGIFLTKTLDETDISIIKEIVGKK